MILQRLDVISSVLRIGKYFRSDILHRIGNVRELRARLLNFPRLQHRVRGIRLSLLRADHSSEATRRPHRQPATQHSTEVRSHQIAGCKSVRGTGSTSTPVGEDRQRNRCHCHGLQGCRVAGLQYCSTTRRVTGWNMSVPATNVTRSAIGSAPEESPRRTESLGCH